VLVTATFLDLLDRPLAGRLVFMPNAVGAVPTGGGRSAVLAPAVVGALVNASGQLVSADGTPDLTLEPSLTGYTVICYLTTVDGQYATFPLTIPPGLSSVDLAQILGGANGAWEIFASLAWADFAALTWAEFAAL
jgi:hypothetical protein